jgi:hypothetical protein
MSCITKLLEMKGDKEILPIHAQAVIEGGGTYKGFEYLITFTRHGTRCGYVALSNYGDCNFDDIHCHGGITFQGNDHGAKALLPIPCEDLWIGFDAAHYGDARDIDRTIKYFGELEPGIEESYRSLNFPEDIHRTFKYMEQNCFSIIDQLLERNVA